MALTNMRFKDQFGLQREEEKNVKAKKEKKRKRKRRRRGRGREAKIKLRYGTLGFGMETEIMYEFPCFDGYNLAQI